MTYQYYEWTGFREADLLESGDRSLGHGDVFTMPASATVCLSTHDNDRTLSGDNWCNEQANDGTGQWAKVDGVRVGGQFYAEKYHILNGSDGKTYYLIEIEVEEHDAEGTGDDYFTFYGDVPPEGTELTVAGACNVKGDWVDYTCLDAGPKIEPDPWMFDPDTCTYTIEAENLDLHNFHVVNGAQASGGELVRISGNDGSLSTQFGGTTGVYDLTICAQDETDGASKLKVFVNGEFQQVVKLDRQSDGVGSDDGGFSAFTLLGLEIAEGDTVEIRAWKDCGEWVRIDALKFEQVKFEVCDDPDAVKVDFEGFAAGDVLGTEVDGLTISATGGSGDAMVFDSQNPTGGDGDLETQVAQQGNVLIVSEDGDGSDPDDAVGGTLTFDFDNPSKVFDLKVIDTEEGGTITLTLEDGSTQTFEIPNLVNGGVGQVVMDVEGVVSMEVALNGSGAVDDLCFVPGAPPLGSLSGRYFCDENYNDVDDGNGVGNVEPGIAGVRVDLLDADGAETGTFTFTDVEGNYQFADLVPGTYGVKFTDPDGVIGSKTLVEANAGDDAIDSDAIGDATMSTISGITVVAGQDTPDNDAGVEELGSLSGRYFCDENRDGLDNDGTGGGASPAVVGILVELLDAGGNGTGITTRTDDAGNYSFTGLVPGSYGVRFTDDTGVTLGKFLTTANVDANGDGIDDDDALDSDAVGNSLVSTIGDITVVAGQDTPDNDAGIFPNGGPEPNEELIEAKGCADEFIFVDLLANVTDPDGDMVSVASISDADETAGVGETITLEDGATVTLNADGTVTVDGIAAYADLDIGEEDVDGFSYTLSDGVGGTAAGDVEVTFCGDANSVDSFYASLPTSGTYNVFYALDEGAPVPSYAFDLEIVDSGDARIDGVLFTAAYCLDFDTAVDTITGGGDINIGAIFGSQSAAALGAFDPNTVSNANGLPGAENLDLINWIVSQDFEGQGFSGWEVQIAIWELADDFDATEVNYAAFDDTDLAGVQTILDAALDPVNEGFEFAVGDTVGMIVDPGNSDPDNLQPFIVALNWEDYDCLC